MQTGPQIIANYIATHEIDYEAFVAWARDEEVREEELNHYEIRHLIRLEEFVAWRNTEADTTVARPTTSPNPSRCPRPAAPVGPGRGWLPAQEPPRASVE